MIRGLHPPANDNQRAADFLCGEIGTDNPFVQWRGKLPVVVNTAKSER